MCNVCSPTITEEDGKVNQKTPFSTAAGQSLPLSLLLLQFSSAPMWFTQW